MAGDTKKTGGKKATRPADASERGEMQGSDATEVTGRISEGGGSGETTRASDPMEALFETEEPKDSSDITPR